MRRNLKVGWMETSKKRLSERRKLRLCNICAREFTPQTVFVRYCATCKSESEVLKFSEWLPEVGQVIQEKISA